MLKTIIRKELLENIFSYRFPLFALICVVLIPLSMFVNNAQYAKRLRDYSEQVRLADEADAASRSRTSWPDAWPSRASARPRRSRSSPRASRTPSPAIISSARTGATQGESSSGDESLLSTQGKFDFVFLVQMVISLIGLLFASDVISGEKESGTLRAMLSNRLPRDSVLVGKIARRLPGPLGPFLWPPSSWA